MYSSSRSSTASPLPEPIPSSSRRYKSSRLELSRLVKLGTYVGRLSKLNHMDFEFALWQMIYLFTSPSKVFRNTHYRKQTKNRYSRDDPAFLVLLSVWFVISATCLSIVLHLPFASFIKFLFFVIFVDCIAFGLIVATCLWLIANRFMRSNRSDSFNCEQVEWAFSFDIHLNAFFPPLVIIHFFQIIIYSSMCVSNGSNYLINNSNLLSLSFSLFIVLTDHEHFTARLFANTLFMIAITYYFYITFIGYTSLPYLNRTKLVLYPLVPIYFFYLITLITGPNLCMSILSFYKYRIYY